jgi:hypothetical protein
LTDFTVIEIDPGAQPLISVMPARLEKVEIFEPLALIGTTPVIIIMILSAVIGVLIPFALLTDKVQETN